MDILRIATAGSVDDGKSTLIGRLLYETQSITKDKIEALESASKRKGLDFLDLSLLTDGLIAEREQGITIDVAHIYFSTPKRKYIIADTPGHVEYTRNMVTGASNVALSLILVDARQGIMEQTARHLSIAAMLRIPKVILCINKMDLVAYEEAAFQAVVEPLRALVEKTKFEGQSIDFLPISSLYGENITQVSSAMPWYQGPSLLQALEAYDAQSTRTQAPARFPVQWVIRPKTEAFHDYRAYAGKVASGQFKVGDEVRVLPTREVAKIAKIERFEDSLSAAQAGASVSVLLDRDVDISRGNMLVLASENTPPQQKDFGANVVWLDRNPLVAGKTYLLQHGVHQTKAKIVQIDHGYQVEDQGKTLNMSELNINSMGHIQVRTAQAIAADAYASNPSNGAFILIDEFSNATVGVGFVD